jgi:hypothetical protein
MTGTLFMELREPGGVWGGLIPIGGAMIIIAAVWLTFMLWPRLAPRRTGCD